MHARKLVMGSEIFLNNSRDGVSRAYNAAPLSVLSHGAQDAALRAGPSIVGKEERGLQHGRQVWVGCVLVYL